MDSSGFVEEIEYRELNFCEVVGRGAFGVVSRAKWRDIDVAVKLIETETERKAFITELKQLSRVCHPNIVKLYGACTKSPVCLVMEYAEGGSLYNVLHGHVFQPKYTCGHAMSWALQCAKGVDYLHSMKPKPLMHRDLKPPNLLLVLGGTILKICDFGTACDAHTHMTNNKGSAAWMAPEVFEGNNYSEKCDVFSFGIILWEVLTRRKPFDEIGGGAFRIMWAVHNGTRPPLIKDCPKPLELLMTKCWSQNPVERPPMAEVVRIMDNLSQFFTGGDEPLDYQTVSSPDGTSPARQNVVKQQSQSSVYDTPPMTNSTHITSPEGRANTIRDTVREALGKTEQVPVVMATPTAQPVVIEGELPMRTSAPASLAASRESLLDQRSRSSTPSVEGPKRYSADLTKLEEVDIMNSQNNMSQHQMNKMRGHRRTGSYGNSPMTAPINVPSPRSESPATHNGMSPSRSLHHVQTAPANLVDAMIGSSPEVATVHNYPGSVFSVQSQGQYMPGHLDAETLAYIALDHQLQPLTPCTTSQESMNIYEQHCKKAQEYRNLQLEISVLTQKRCELLREERAVTDEEDSEQIIKEYNELWTENESLTMLYNNLKKQVEQIKNQQPNRYLAGV